VNQEHNDQVIGDIVWETLSSDVTKPVSWGILREMIRNFAKSQLSDVRALDDDELLHIQCMIFLPLALRFAIIFKAKSLFRLHSREFDDSDDEESKTTELTDLLAQFEMDLFLRTIEKSDLIGIKRIKYRLLREFVRDDFAISHEIFMQVMSIFFVNWLPFFIYSKNVSVFVTAAHHSITLSGSGCSRQTS
jgi:hypothetical protein